MTIDDRFARLDTNDDEFLQFNKIDGKRSQRPDLHAFLLLDELFPSDQDMVCAAEHDEIWLEPDEASLEKLSDDQILELIRCGVRVSEYGGLTMFA